MNLIKIFKGFPSILSRVLFEEKNCQLEGEAFWGVVHAVYLLGIFGDLRGFDALIFARKFGTV
jgi:hypothetical protein